MTAESPNDISVASVVASSQPDPLVPAGLAECAIWARHFWNTWQLLPICTMVTVPMRRVGDYAFVDILLVLLAHACSGNRSLGETSCRFRPVAPALMSLWGRDAMPSASQIGRWLARIDEWSMEAWRSLFFTTSVSTGCADHAWAASSARTVAAR